MAEINSVTGTADTLEALDGVHAVYGVILEGDFDCARRGLTFNELVVEDVALLEENLGDLLLEVGGRNLDHTVLGLDGIPQSCQIICYWICHCFEMF